MTSLRWGVLSTADIARKKVIPGLLKAERCEVVAIASRDAAQARTVADELGIPTAHGSYEALLADPDVDVVYIPLPNHLHAEWTIAAARAGKHVLCEKPLAMTAADAERMVEACADGRRPADGGVHVSPPSVVGRRHASVVSSGRLGRLRAVQSWFSYYNDDPANIRNQLEVGGGALFDIGCYSVNLSRMLFGAEPTAVEASVIRDPATGVDTLTSAILEFAGRRRHLHLLDPRRDRPARPRLRQRRAAVDRDPVQHPARPADTRLRDRRRRPAGRTGDRDTDVPDQGPVHGRGRALRGRDPRWHPDARPRPRTPSPTCVSSSGSSRPGTDAGRRDDATTGERGCPTFALPDFGIARHRAGDPGRDPYRCASTASVRRWTAAATTGSSSTPIASTAPTSRG